MCKKKKTQDRWDNECFKEQRDTVVLDTTSARVALIKNSTTFMYCNKRKE